MNNRQIKAFCAVLAILLFMPRVVLADVSQSEYDRMRDSYDNQINELNRQIRALQDEIADQEVNGKKNLPLAPKIKLQSPTTITFTSIGRRTEDISIKNVGTDLAFNVVTQIELPSGSPFSAKFINNDGYFTSIGASSTQKLRMQIDPDPNATAGTYPLTLNYTYLDEKNVEKKETDTLYIKIERILSASTVSLYDFKTDKENLAAGDVFKLSARLENMSSSVVNDVQVSPDGLKSGEVYLAGSGGSAYFKTMSRNESQTVSFSIKIADKAKYGTYPITFKVSYKDQQNKDQEGAYTYYVTISSGSSGADAAGLRVGAVSYPTKTVSVGEDFTVTLPLINSGKEAAQNIKITANAGGAGAATGGDGGVVPKSADTQVITSLAPGASDSVSFTFAATSAAKSQNYTIGFSIEYETGRVNDDDTKEKETFSQYAGVNVYNPNGGDGKTNVPKIIVSKYSADPVIVSAGKNFDLSITFMNTHADKEIRNIKAYFTAEDTTTSSTGNTSSRGSVFTPVNASNTFYIDKIPPKGEAEEKITFYTVPDADPKNYILKINFDYEDADGNPYQSVEQVGVNVKQTTKFEMGDVNIQEYGSVGQPVPISFEFYNTGKVTLSNLIIKIEGDFDVSNTSSYYSNFEPGKSDSYDMSFTPSSAGDKDGKIVISYQDDSGEQITEFKEFKISVSEAAPEDDMGGMEAPPPPEGFFSRHKKLIFIGGGAFVAAAAVTVFLLVRRARRRKRQRLEEEADL
ncbi:MAG: hypothetical protein LBU36_08335 [Clostridiales bacterium]|nr:hypothetical protein [Clostridiales bacterium]